MALRELLYLASVLTVCWGSGQLYQTRAAPSSIVPGLSSTTLARQQERFFPTNPPGGIPGVSGSPSGRNVCSREVLKTEWVDVDMTYACWQTEEVDRSFCRDPREGRRECYWGRDWRRDWRHHFRGKRQADGCYKLVLRTCSKTVKKLISHAITEHVCCPGFEGDPFRQCHSSASCSVNNGGCEHICTHDVFGTQRCACFPGFRMMGEKCIDLNECLSSPCNHQCENTAGSFYCSCNPGYALISATHCAEINECAVGNGGCQHNCFNTIAAFYCTCDGGFDLRTGFQCEDVDECALHNGGCSHTCVNQYGYYDCLCPENAYLLKDNKTCEGFTTKSGSSVRPPVAEVPGAEASRGGSHNEVNMSMALIVAPCAGGIFLLLLVAIIGCCLYRRCRREHAEHHPPPPAFPVVAVISDNDYDDSLVCALKKKKEAEAGCSYDNPGYEEEPSKPPTPPPSYSDHSYCYIKPPSYEEQEKPETTPSMPKAAAKGPEYDNANEEKKPNSVSKLMENFEKKPGNMERSDRPLREGRAASHKVMEYDNVINELKRIDN